MFTVWEEHYCICCVLFVCCGAVYDYESWWPVPVNGRWRRCSRRLAYTRPQASLLFPSMWQQRAVSGTVVWSEVRQLVLSFLLSISMCCCLILSFHQWCVQMLHIHFGPRSLRSSVSYHFGPKDRSDAATSVLCLFNSVPRCYSVAAIQHRVESVTERSTRGNT